MLNEPTLQMLNAMRLTAMASAWLEQQADPKVAELSFDERLGLIVQVEHQARENRKMTRRLGEAKLKIPSACIEDIDCSARRGLERALVRQLATCRWIDEKNNVLITGASGTGKTFVGCALSQNACRRGYRSIYRRVPRLFEELALAHADGTYTKLLAKLARVDVLVLDDWGIAPLKDAQRRDLLEILDDRYGARSTILTSQVPQAKWHDHIGDPTVADAILDRLVHNAYRIDLKGPSRRKENAKK